MEIERIQQLAEKLENDDERTEILSTIDVFSVAFTRMLRSSKQFMLEGIRQETDLKEAKNALQLLYDIGARHGYVFPMAGNEKAVAEYIIRFRREVVFSKQEAD